MKGEYGLSFRKNRLWKWSFYPDANFDERQKNEDFLKTLDLIWNFQEISKCKSRGFSPNSTSLSDVNLVDGLPSARHNTEAVGGAHGVFGPATICTFDKKMYEIEQIGYMKMDERRVEVKVCIWKVNIG